MTTASKAIRTAFCAAGKHGDSSRVNLVGLDVHAAGDAWASFSGECTGVVRIASHLHLCECECHA